MSKHTWDAQTYDAKHNFVWKLAAGVIELLEPKKGERILDLGCGTGHLTAKIAESGAQVVGLDPSERMLAQARDAYPKLELHQGDGRDFSFPEPFDAVFTNATLHWIPEADAVIAAVARNLKPGGRFVGEFGGKGNVATLHQSLAEAAAQLGLPAFEPNHTHYFPSPAEYATKLENGGFEISFLTIFDRPTPLEGEHGGRNWLKQFCAFYLDGLEAGPREAVLDKAEEIMRPKLYKDGGWHADYRRLRFVGRRV